MRFVANADALIIDLRENRGGSTAMAREIASYFVKGRAHWSDTYNRLTGKWTENWIENRPATTAGIYLGMPVTILTSSWTFSAAEGIAYDLKYNRNARIVGQPTAGGAHVLRRVPLGNGFVGFIPYIRSVNVVTKTDWEGTGVTPDVAADPPLALLRAQEAILGERIVAEKDSLRRRASEWAINEARSRANEVDVPISMLRSYEGQFEEYTFSLRDNRLYSANSSRNDKIDKLTPITPALFQIDWESQVEFVRDSAGSVSSIRILWNDGWVDTITRAK
jgi:retinol-binding protein 3